MTHVLIIALLCILFLRRHLFKSGIFSHIFVRLLVVYFLSFFAFKVFNLNLHTISTRDLFTFILRDYWIYLVDPELTFVFFFCYLFHCDHDPDELVLVTLLQCIV